MFGHHFVSNYCPYFQSYRQRIVQLADAYEKKQNKVKFILINPENAHDTEETMRSDAQFFQLPYLWDKGQEIATRLKATKTPEAFVLQKNLDQFVIKYNGAIDDNPQLAEEVNSFYLKDAIEAVLGKRNINGATQRPTGCMIKE
ncbi:MAG: redoxin domain-containing protein [Bacteroidia bacterium]|nr:redoxin domain-containing protein [Bacteroidia bacterium]